MKKLSEYKEEDRDKIGSQINEGTAKLALGDYDYEALNLSGDFDGFGLCNDCKSLRATKTAYGKIYVFCTEWNKQLSGGDLIEKCTHYTKRGTMTLSDMKDIAVIIDINKNTIGF